MLATATESLPTVSSDHSTGMDVGGPGAAVFFIFVLVVGCYLILNLFVAILLEAFATPEEEEEEDSPVEEASDGGGGAPSDSPLPSGRCAPQTKS